MKKKERAIVLSQECIATDIYSMWIETPDIAAEAIPGQFITLYTNDADKLLPRPISLCEIDKKNGRLRIVYRIAGAGTKEFSAYKAGDAVEIMGPLGNGFPVEKAQGKNEPDQVVAVMKEVKKLLAKIQKQEENHAA